MDKATTNRALLGALFILLFVIFALLVSLTNSGYVPAF